MCTALGLRSRLRMKGRSLLTSCVTLLFVSCSGILDLCGSDVGRFGLDIRVLDDRTSAPPTVEVTVHVRDGDYSETARSGQPVGVAMHIPAAPERPGKYTLTVTAPGYQTQVISDLTVQRSGRCDYLQTVVVNVRLREAI